MWGPSILPQFSSSSHHTLIWHVSGVLDSPVSAAEAEINTSEKRNVKEGRVELHRLAPALHVAGTARCLACPQPTSGSHHRLGRGSNLEDMDLAGGDVRGGRHVSLCQPRSCRGLPEPPRSPSRAQQSCRSVHRVPTLGCRQ